MVDGFPRACTFQFLIRNLLFGMSQTHMFVMLNRLRILYYGCFFHVILPTACTGHCLHHCLFLVLRFHAALCVVKKVRSGDRSCGRTGSETTETRILWCEHAFFLSLLDCNDLIFLPYSAVYVCRRSFPLRLFQFWR